MRKTPFKRNPYLRDKVGLTDFSLKSRFHCIFNTFLDIFQKYFTAIAGHWWPLQLWLRPLPRPSGESTPCSSEWGRRRSGKSCKKLWRNSTRSRGLWGQCKNWKCRRKSWRRPPLQGMFWLLSRFYHVQETCYKDRHVIHVHSFGLSRFGIYLKTVSSLCLGKG